MSLHKTSNKIFQYIEHDIENNNSVVLCESKVSIVLHLKLLSKYKKFCDHCEIHKNHENILIPEIWSYVYGMTENRSISVRCVNILEQLTKSLVNISNASLA